LDNLIKAFLGYAANEEIEKLLEEKDRRETIARDGLTQDFLYIMSNCKCEECGKKLIWETGMGANYLDLYSKCCSKEYLLKPIVGRIKILDT